MELKNILNERTHAQKYAWKTSRCTVGCENPQRAPRHPWGFPPSCHLEPNSPALKLKEEVTAEKGILTWGSLSPLGAPKFTC